MFEKVLKRLCPCYFPKSDDTDVSGCSTDLKKTSDVKPTNRLSQKGDSDNSNLNSSTSNSSNSSSLSGNWKGTLNIVQPQPVYAIPVGEDQELKKPKQRNHRNLLKPPLLWKKTMKNLHSEGPPVFQESMSKNPLKPRKKTEKKKNIPRHSETVADITSVTSPSTVEIRWLKSQSLDNVSFETSTDDKKGSSCKKDSLSARNEGDGSVFPRRKNAGGGDHGPKDWNYLKCQVLPDLSHGVILFTAAYFNKKKICMINIDRLENLSKKGREGNSYYTVVKLAVLPSEKYIRCSKVLNNCSNPEVKQDFSFSMKESTGKILRLSVFDASLQKQHEAVGHALLTLDDIISDQPKRYRIKLYRRTQPHVCPGNLSLFLRYITGEDKFTITVNEGRNLSLQKDKNLKLNTYVKVTLYAYGEKVKTKKSIVIMDSRDPNYNSTFTFQIRKDQIDHLSVGVTVRLKGFVNDITIGRLNFGPFFYVEDHKLTPWGRVFLKRELVSHWFRMYL